MKKILEKITRIMACKGVFIIVLTTCIIENYILFYVGIGMLIIGIIGTLATREKTKEVIWKLLELI